MAINNERCMGYLLTNDSWSLKQCTKNGMPEPAVRTAYDYVSGDAKEIPNMRYGESVEGKSYCGTHSPSKKSLRELARQLERVASARNAADIRSRANMRMAADLALITDCMAGKIFLSEDVRKAFENVSAAALRSTATNY